MSPQQRTALLSVFAAAALVALKLATGLVSGSLGLIAEALHSGTDLVAALLTFFAVRVAERPPDLDHPYGHGKAEHLAALGEAGFLVLVSGLISAQSLARLISGEGHAVDAAWYALAVIGLVIVIDVSRATVSWRASKRYHSAALASNALHFASDLVGSVAVLAGLLLVRAGYPSADAIAALFVAVLVVLAAVRLMRQNVNVLMDRSPAGAQDQVRRAIEQAEPTVEVRRLRVREAAGRHFVDVVVGVHADDAVGQAHATADSVEGAVHQVLPGSDVVVHTEPQEGAAGDLRERASGAALTVRGVREVHNVSVASVAGRHELSLHLKLPPDLTLDDAHDVATLVEQAIQQAVPEICDVHTHIEPLASGEVDLREAGRDVAVAEGEIRRVVAARTGRPPQSLRLRHDTRGLVALVTVVLPRTAALGDAHDVASEIEQEIRAVRPDIVEAVIHTEPA